ncbi:MAG TPA: hypothetical protein VEJ23_08580 [Solirubrobacteraceae bacterium]|nr:hypothetical protein [Solirubrobacteraceae bacterium]
MSYRRKGGRLGLTASCALALGLAAATAAAGAPAGASPAAPGGSPRGSQAAPVRLAAPLAAPMLASACLEPQYIELVSTVAGQPFAFSEALECLPAEDRLSQPTVLWGDGTTSPGTVVPSRGAGGDEGVSAQHTYASAGGFQISVHVTDVTTGEVLTRGWHTTVEVVGPGSATPGSAPGPVPTPAGSSGSPPPPASRADGAGAPPGASGEAAGVRAVSFSARAGRRWRGAVAVVRASAPASDLRALIRWGDGSVTRGVVRGHPPELTVLGAHRWRRPGRYRITVLLASARGRALATGVARAHVR